MSVRQVHEADHYGFSNWLAKKLNLSKIPLSLRGIQHGWIWWDVRDIPAKRGFGFDPNLSTYWGELTQDELTSKFLVDRGIYSKPSGLPFSIYWNHEKDNYLRKRSGVLFVPSHSNPWVDNSTAISSQIRQLKQNGLDVDGIMLGASDFTNSHLYDIKDVKIERGAGVFDRDSFHRLSDIFSRYEYMISASIGSHIAYALLTGMKVGISRSILISEEKLLGEEKLYKLDEYLDMIYPGLITDSHKPEYMTKPIFANMELFEIAKELGWEYTSPLVEYEVLRMERGSTDSL